MDKETKWYVNHQFTITEELMYKMQDFLHSLPEEYSKDPMCKTLIYCISEGVSDKAKFQVLTERMV